MLALLKNQLLVLGLVVAAAVIALSAAMIAQHAYGMEPCIMCIYQRIPFAIVVLVGMMGLMRERMIRPALKISMVMMAVNVGLALYHSGIERKWWVSAVEGCKVPIMNGDTEALLTQLMKAPTARCDEIPWVDPLLGLSMANWNVPFCLGLFLLCAVCLYLTRRPQHSATP